MKDITSEIELANSSLKYTENERKIRNNEITLVFRKSIQSK